MAGFMDMLGKRPETESGSSYQRTVLREVARKLNDLEEQNEQNALAIEETGNCREPYCSGWMQ